DVCSTNRHVNKGVMTWPQKAPRAVTPPTRSSPVCWRTLRRRHCDGHAFQSAIQATAFCNAPIRTTSPTNDPMARRRPLSSILHTAAVFALAGALSGAAVDLAAARGGGFGGGFGGGGFGGGGFGGGGGHIGGIGSDFVAGSGGGF